MRARILAAGDGRAPPAVAVLLEDRAQAAQRAAELAPEPGAAREDLEQAVGGQRGRVSSVHSTRVSPPGAGVRRNSPRWRMRLNLPPRPRWTIR